MLNMVSVNVRYVRNFAKSCAKILGNAISNIEKLILLYVTLTPITGLKFIATKP
ncbi:MAG: hypothetical protein RLZZ148_2113 [Cyanobacteriota bacterium]